MDKQANIAIREQGTHLAQGCPLLALSRFEGPRDGEVGPPVIVDAEEEPLCISGIGRHQDQAWRIASYQRLAIVDPQHPGGAVGPQRIDLPLVFT
jgi:hypothetical protein